MCFIIRHVETWTVEYRPFMIVHTTRITFHNIYQLLMNYCLIIVLRICHLFRSNCNVETEQGQFTALKYESSRISTLKNDSSQISTLKNKTVFYCFVFVFIAQNFHCLNLQRRQMTPSHFSTGVLHRKHVSQLINIIYRCYVTISMVQVLACIP